MQIIVGAMVAGCVFFLAIALVAGQQGGLVLAPPDLLTLIAAGVAGAALVARLVVVSVVTAFGRRRIARRNDTDLHDPSVCRGLVALYQTRMIVGAALIEGPTFFLLIAYLSERSPLALILAVVLILGLALHMPTRGRVTRWIEGQMRRMDEGREFDVKSTRDFRGT